MPISDEEVASLVASGEAQTNPDMSITWAKSNTLGHRAGTWLRRPPGAAEIITTDKAVDLGKARQEKRRLAIEDGFAQGVGKKLNMSLTTDEAIAAMIAKLGEMGVDTDRKDVLQAIRLAIEVLGLGPKKEINIDQRKQIIEIDQAEFNLMKDWRPIGDGD